MLREQQVLGLVGQIYDAALDVTQWPSVLQNLVRLTHSNTGNLAELGLSSGATTPIASVNMPLSSFSDYETHYSQADASDDEHRPHAVETGSSENNVAAGSHQAAGLASWSARPGRNA